MSNKLDILRVRDKLDNYGTKKNKTPNLSQRALFIARSGCGKTNLLVNLLLRKEDDFYLKDFDGEDIYIISPSLNSDDKLQIIVRQKEIPECNLFDTYDPDILMSIYEMIKDEYMTSVGNKERPRNSLVIIDDCAEMLKEGGRHNPLEKLYIAGRHYNISTWTTSQYYCSVPPVVRNNSNVIYLYPTNHKELVKFAEEHSNVDSNTFIRKFREHTDGADHHFILVDYTKPPKQRFKNHQFEVIEMV